MLPHVPSLRSAPMLAAIASVLLTQAVWLGSKWYYQDWFADPFKYPAKAASLAAMVLMCWCVVLATRWRPLERLCGGLDKLYQVHRRLGRWAFFAIIAHPVCLGAHQLPSLPGFLDYAWLRIPHGDRYLWGQNLGVLTFALMAVLMILTLRRRLAYHRWKVTHEWFALVMLLAAGHIFVVDADVAAYPLLRIWLWTLLGLALAACLWTRLLYRHLGPRYRYRIRHLGVTADILELELEPVAAKMDFLPSQFVYLVADKSGIPPEPHPFSIACGYNLEAAFKLGIKQIGDHTRRLVNLARGDEVTIYGPYGMFSRRFLGAHRDCVFIGGGIGITPFLGMWHVALHSEERLDASDVPQRLTRMHPEIIKTWKSPCVALFYVCRTAAEASFDNDIRREVILSHFHGFNALQARGHHYELYLSSQQGRFTADYAAAQLPDGVADLIRRDIYLCGPPAMMADLIRQLVDLGVPREHIVVEDFNLV